jgi:RNA polymerase sigma factor (sigma-70 family)
MLSNAVVPARSGEIVADDWDWVVELIYTRWAARVAEYARRMNVDPGAADDVMQESFARLFALAPGRRPNEPLAWLFRVAHNLAMDRHRRGARLRAVFVPPAAPSAGIASAAATAPADDAMERAELWAHVEELPPRQRAAVFLRYRADLDFATVARILEITESGARASVFRGLATLRAKLGEDRHD